ncbi:AAA family ATPase [Mucilaginibacter aquariorum]|uniref:AAA family ATPase n=1 Tax=Mucilaginibacter aquariorum TaxID=2967225 RepID=A0ABT1T2T6_9SPHI|nr:AAA family ATPase [Mucilaginibacter aquariorum]MCQ6958730.1 AAA family ATPase [Mucilaginibacter aquariorum]
MIVIVCGLPGTGKTFFASALASRLNARLISSDVVRTNLKRRGKYDEDNKNAVYAAMLLILAEALQDHDSVVLDATFYKSAIRDLFTAKARQYGEPFYFIQLLASGKTIKERMKQKRRDSEADFDVYLKIKAAFEPLTERHLDLNSEEEQLQAMLSQALSFIRQTYHEIR